MEPKEKETKQADQEEKGFAVHDKRRIGKEDAPEEASDRPEEPAGGTGGPPPEEKSETGRSGEPGDARPDESRSGPEAGGRTYAPLTFASFIMSLSTSALIYLGQVPDPVSGKTVTDLLAARQTIDLITLLKDKTKGNLTSDEEAFIDGILYDLRMLFVKAGE